MHLPNNQPRSRREFTLLELDTEAVGDKRLKRIETTTSFYDNKDNIKDLVLCHEVAAGQEVSSSTSAGSDCLRVEDATLEEASIVTLGVVCILVVAFILVYFRNRRGQEGARHRNRHSAGDEIVGSD